MNKTRVIIAALFITGIVTLLGFGIQARASAEQTRQAEATLAAPPATGVTTIEMRNSRFVTANIEVAVGTTVTWTNADATQHTVTFRDRTVDSGTLPRGQSFRRTFTTPGVYEYYCIPHPDQMIGRVTVR